MDSQRIHVRLTPRSSRDEIVSWDAESWRLAVRVKAAPVDDAANEALISLLSKRLKVPKSGIRIVAGARSRNKTVEIYTDQSIWLRLDSD